MPRPIHKTDIYAARGGEISRPCQEDAGEGHRHEAGSFLRYIDPPSLEGLPAGRRDAGIAAEVDGLQEAGDLLRQYRPSAIIQRR